MKTLLFSSMLMLSGAGFAMSYLGHNYFLLGLNGLMILYWFVRLNSK